MSINLLKIKSTLKSRKRNFWPQHQRVKEKSEGPLLVALHKQITNDQRFAFCDLPKPKLVLLMSYSLRMQALSECIKRAWRKEAKEARRKKNRKRLQLRLQNIILDGETKASLWTAKPKHHFEWQN